MMLGQMRLAWWRDVITKSVNDRPKGDPVLAGLSGLEAKGLNLADIVPVIDAWELLLVQEEITLAQLEDYAALRGRTIFVTISELLEIGGQKAILETAGSLWAKWDLARHSADDALRERLMADIAFMQRNITESSMPRRLRPLSIFVQLAKSDIKNGNSDRSLMRPATAARVLWHGITGLR